MISPLPGGEDGQIEYFCGVCSRRFWLKYSGWIGRLPNLLGWLSMPGMYDIVITEFMDEAALANIPSRNRVLYDPVLVDDAERLRDVASNARALIVRNRTQVRGDLLEALPRLECVGRLGVGLDNIDLEACRMRGIEVFPATGTNDLSVAEYVITMALVLRRGAYFSSTRVAAGDWPRQELIGLELSGATMGLVGFGAISRQVATRALAFGMRVLAHDPYVSTDDGAWGEVEQCRLDQLYSQADVVSLHTPLNEETRHLIDGAALSKFKHGAVLINAARGGVVDEDAAVDALRSGQLGGLAFDVFENEPLGNGDGAKFSGLENVILTPHIAGVTQEANRRISFVTVSSVLAHLEADRTID